MSAERTERHWVIGLAGILLGCVVGGCATLDQDPADEFAAKWTAARDASLRSVIEGNAALVAAVEAEEAELDEPLVSFSPEIDADRRLPTGIVQELVLTEETAVSEVLRTLAEAGDQDILLGEGVTQKVQVRLDNVPWNQAFKSVLSTAGLSYEWEGDIIRVLSVEDMQKKLEIQRLRQESQSIQAASRLVEPLHVKLIRIRFSNAERLGKTIERLLVVSAEGGQKGAVTVDTESNTLVVHAIPSEIEKISHLVARLDRPKPQVLIESKIVETNRSTARELGVQWGGGAETVGGNRIHTFNGQLLGGFALNTPASLDDSVGFGLGYEAVRLGGGEVLEMQLTALQEDGKINILSSPSITTLDNETALIEAGEERAYRKTTVSGNDLDLSVEWKTASLKLEVTPHVIQPQLLRLDVMVNKDSFDDSKPASNGEFPVNTKKARTTLLLRNGETTVIGGLSQESTSDATRGIPILKDIPFLGYLFRGRGTGREFDEIMIFITPRVLLEKADYAAAMVPEKEELGEAQE